MEEYKYYEYMRKTAEKFGFFWEYDKFLLKNKTLEEIKSQITDTEELEYFEKFENSMIGKFLSTLTREELNSIMKYSASIGSTFKEINNGLRNNNFSDPYYKQECDNLDKACSKFELTEDTIMYRGIKEDTFKHLGINSIEELSTLQNFTDKGFMSCSLYPDTSYAYFKEYPLMLEILVPAGTNGMYIDYTKPKRGMDFEYVLARGTNLNITGFRKKYINGEEKIVISSAVQKERSIDKITR